MCSKVFSIGVTLNIALTFVINIFPNELVQNMYHLFWSILLLTYENYFAVHIAHLYYLNLNICDLFQNVFFTRCLLPSRKFLTTDVTSPLPISSPSLGQTCVRLAALSIYWPQSTNAGQAMFCFTSGPWVLSYKWERVLLLVRVAENLLEIYQKTLRWSSCSISQVKVRCFYHTAALC